MLYKKQSNRSCGFTLVELSLVIVIIGLIVAGIVGGQSLVKQSQLRSVASDFQKYDTAINAFYLAYDQLPGDFSLAVAHWGAGVNNGNNDRKITSHTGSFAHEGIDAWEHLYKSDILPVQYIGNSVTGVIDNPIAGVNVPKSSYPSHFFSIFQSDSSIFGVNPKFFFVLARPDTILPWCGWCEGDLQPYESKIVDQKIDDGVANKGRLLGVTGNSDAAASCSGSYVTAGADYNLASNIKSCRLFFVGKNK